MLSVPSIDTLLRSNNVYASTFNFRVENTRERNAREKTQRSTAVVILPAIAFKHKVRKTTVKF